MLAVEMDAVNVCPLTVRVRVWVTVCRRRRRRQQHSFHPPNKLIIDNCESKQTHSIRISCAVKTLTMTNSPYRTFSDGTLTGPELLVSINWHETCANRARAHPHVHMYDLYGASHHMHFGKYKNTSFGRWAPIAYTAQQSATFTHCCCGFSCKINNKIFWRLTQIHHYCCTWTFERTTHIRIIVSNVWNVCAQWKLVSDVRCVVRAKKKEEEV